MIAQYRRYRPFSAENQRSTSPQKTCFLWPGYHESLEHYVGAPYAFPRHGTPMSRGACKGLGTETHGRSACMGPGRPTSLKVVPVMVFTTRPTLRIISSFFESRTTSRGPSFGCLSSQDMANIPGYISDYAPFPFQEVLRSYRSVYPGQGGPWPASHDGGQTRFPSPK